MMTMRAGTAYQRDHHLVGTAQRKESPRFSMTYRACKFSPSHTISRMQHRSIISAYRSIRIRLTSQFDRFHYVCTNHKVYVLALAKVASHFDLPLHYLAAACWLLAAAARLSSCSYHMMIGIETSMHESTIQTGRKTSGSRCVNRSGLFQKTNMPDHEHA